MNRTMDAETPIFRQLNEELELPEITVHDFDSHDFDFVREGERQEGADARESGDNSDSMAASENPRARKGGRRRKED